MKRLLLIVNPRAGKSKSLGPLYDAIARLSAGGYLVYVRETKGPGDATRFARDLGPDFDTVVCYGGDGTLNETISGLMQLERKPPLGYLPSGSTNDFAATLHIPAAPYLAADIIAQGTPIALDMWPPSVPSPGPATPHLRRQKTPWVTSPTFWRA